MIDLTVNLDACRLASEILLRLRTVVREALQARHGDAWPTAGIPGELQGYLSGRQAREASINWNLSDRTDFLDFAGFANLHDIIQLDDDLRVLLSPLAPDSSLMRLRFLGLDTILARCAYARPVSEADLGLLATFDDRLKRCLATPTTGTSHKPGKPGPPRREPATPPPPPAVEADDQTGSPAPAPLKPEPAPDKQPTAAKPEPAAPVVKARAEVDVPPLPVVAPPPVLATPATPRSTEAPKSVPPVSSAELERAIGAGDDRVLLSALYHEVTSLADRLWNGNAGGGPGPVWEQVRESRWYRGRFAALGLRALSDFHGLHEAARDKVADGATRAELQDFLKEHSFVQVLLALKDLFRQHLAG